MLIKIKETWKEIYKNKSKKTSKENFLIELEQW